MRNTGIAAALALALVALVGCSEDSTPAKGFEVTEQGIKSLDKNIAKADVTPQVDGVTNLVEVRVNRNPLTGGKNDWNWIAQDGHRLMTKLLAKPEVSRIRLVYIAPDSNNLDWAYINVARSELPSDWETLSYLQFFGKTKPQPGTVDAARWLCDFYATYRSSQPANGLPSTCKGY